MARPVYKNYLTISLLFTACLIIGNAITNYYTYYIRKQTDETGLLSYQIQKIEQYRHQEIDTIFVGDSSLGHSIDAKLFDEMAQTRSLNLALTVLHGYGGSLNMIRRAIKRYPIRRVILVQSLNVMKAWNYATCDGYLFTNGVLPISNVPPEKLWPCSRDFVKRLLARISWQQLGQLLSEPSYALIQDDYPYQGERRSKEDILAAEGNSVVEMVDAKQLTFLSEIAKLAKAHNIEIFYAYGPLEFRVLNQSKAYIQESNRRIRSKGIHLLTESPPPIFDDAVGDHPAHPAPHAKPEFTKLYAHLLKQYKSGGQSKIN